MSGSIQDIPLKAIDGTETTLRSYAGDVLLVVNVASKCGLTPQYAGLETLYETYRAQGFKVLGFPANNFREQEPGTDSEIAAFCESTYNVQFPLFAKLSVAGESRHPLFAALTTAQPHATSTAADGGMRQKLAGYGITPNPEPELLWNFEKFIIGRSGAVVARFAPDTAPDDPALIAVVERELAA